MHSSAETALPPTREVSGVPAVPPQRAAELPANLATNPEGVSFEQHEALVNQLEQEIKTIIIEALALEDVAPDDIDPAAPLFGEGLGLDSIDALELGIAIKKKYNVNLSAEDKENRKHFYSVRTLAEFVAGHKT